MDYAMGSTRQEKRGSVAWRTRIGAALRALREDRRLTQSDLALAAGVVIDTVSKTEKGKTVPDFATLEAFADVLGVSLDALVGRRGVPTAPAEMGLRSEAEQVVRAVAATLEIRDELHDLRARVERLESLPSNVEE